MANKRISHCRWTVAVIAIICLPVIYGVRHSFAAFFPSILDEYDWSRGSTAFMFALNVLLYGL